MSDQLLLISSDCHGGPLTREYRPYLEAQYHDDFDRYLQERLHRANLAPNRAGNNDREHRVRFATDLESRLADLEADGVVGEVIFPDGSADNEIPFTGLFGGSGLYSHELQLAALRAYNRWMGEHCTPNRQIGLALIPFDDPEIALVETRRARALGLLGIYPQFDGADTSSPQLYDERFDPVWAACVDDRLPVSFHGSSGLPMRLYASKAGGHILGQEIQFWTQRILWHLILGGVLERFGDLRVGFTEAHSDWIPQALARMDRQWGPPPEAVTGVLDGFTSAAVRECCPQRPSEYFHRQVHVGASALSRHEVEIRHEVGIDAMMFGTDHPHSAATWGCTKEYLQLTFGAASVPENEARAMLGGNIAGLYGFDTAALAPLVDRVGLAVEDVLRPPDAESVAGIPDYLQRRALAMVDRLPR